MGQSDRRTTTDYESIVASVFIIKRYNNMTAARSCGMQRHIISITPVTNIHVNQYTTAASDDIHRTRDLAFMHEVNIETTLRVK